MIIAKIGARILKIGLKIPPNNVPNTSEITFPIAVTPSSKTCVKIPNPAKRSCPKVSFKGVKVIFSDLSHPVELIQIRVLLVVFTQIPSAVCSSVVEFDNFFLQFSAYCVSFRNVSFCPCSSFSILSA